MKKKDNFDGDCEGTGNYTNGFILKTLKFFKVGWKRTFPNWWSIQ